MKKPLLIETQHGLGDNIYHRAFVKTLTERYEVYLNTPFPMIYEDLPVKFIKPISRLRTQAKSIARSKRSYVEVPPHTPVIAPKYGSQHLQRSNIIDGLAQGYACKPSTFDLPKFQTRIKYQDKPICVVRPATIRKEWNAAGRNPLPSYIRDVIEWLRETHFIISVADLEDGEEYALEPLPYADLRLHKGELPTRELLGLIQKADFVVGGVGWIVPACISTGTKLFCILGGTGMYNAPHKITHTSMDLSNVFFAKPDNYCMCSGMQHNCDKKITNLKGMFDGFVRNSK